MPKFFKNRQWLVSAGAAAAGVYGIPYPVECLLDTDTAIDEQSVEVVDWDAELRALNGH